MSSIRQRVGRFRMRAARFPPFPVPLWFAVAGRLRYGICSWRPRNPTRSIGQLESPGIDADRIEALAEEYAKGPSSLALGWGGNDKMTNADIAGHAAAVLAAVTGNVGKPGTGVGVYVGQEYNSYAPSLGAWEMPADWAAVDSEVNIYDMPFKENNCRAAIFCGDIVAQHMANMNETCEWAKTLDFIVTMDPYFTEGAKWSDYILPCTSRFEYDEPYGNVKTGYSQIVIQEKVIDPLFEARTDLWIQRELAKRLGLEAGIPASSVDRCNAILSTSEESVGFPADGREDRGGRCGLARSRSRGDSRGRFRWRLSHAFRSHGALLQQHGALRPAATSLGGPAPRSPTKNCARPSPCS